MANYQFHRDLKDGNEGEDFIARWLESQGFTVTLNRGGNNSSHDMQVAKDGDTLSYEVKTDLYCRPDRDTGNIFIEFWCRDKPSGIAVSKADKLVYYFKFLNEVWIIGLEELRALTAKYKFPERLYAGDRGSGTSGWLIPREEYREHFEVHTV